VLTQMSQTVMHVVDSIFVGRLGAAELGALGFAGIWLWTVFSVFSGTAIGVQTFVSQVHGGGEERTCGAWAWQGLYAVVPAAALAAFALFTSLVARMGNASMAATQAMISLLSLSFMQAIGIGLAATTLVGRYKGAGDLAAAERSYRSALRLAVVLAVGVAALFVLAPEALMRMFVDDPEVIALGGPLLALGAAFQLFDALQIVVGGALRGAGDTRWPFAAHTALGWGFFVPCAWVLGFVLEGGLTGAWLGGTFYVVMLAAVLMWRFHSGAWRRIEI